MSSQYCFYYNITSVQNDDFLPVCSQSEKKSYLNCRHLFPESDSSYIILDAFDMGSMVKIIPSERKVIGYCRNNHGGVPENFHNYFVAVFDKDFESMATWNDRVLNAGDDEDEGNHVGAILGFRT